MPSWYFDLDSGLEAADVALVEGTVSPERIFQMSHSAGNRSPVHLTNYQNKDLKPLPNAREENGVNKKEENSEGKKRPSSKICIFEKVQNILHLESPLSSASSSSADTLDNVEPIPRDTSTEEETTTTSSEDKTQKGIHG